MTAPALAPGLQRKLRKVLDTRTESAEIASSLATLSTFYDDNTANTRRRLRSTIEYQGVKVNEDFLTATEGVISALDSVQEDLDQVAKCCEQMTSWMLENKSSTAGLLLETERLQRALRISEARSQLLGTFLSQYQLSPSETEALQSEEMTAEFFDALDHVRTIHANCRNLLRTNHQRVGLELLDSMSSLQEGAYERLCRWIQNECRTLSDIDFPEVDPLLQRAVNSLKGRRVLFTYCAEEVATARQTALFQRFIRALTRGPRPIEMHAPDPWRYASDMLAWVHTSLASEREFLTGLLGDDFADMSLSMSADTTNNDISLQQGEEPLITIEQLMSTVFEGICRPLRVRIEQILVSAPPPLLSFRLAQLLAFYLQTVDSMLGIANPLSDTLNSCYSMAMRSFYEHLRHKGDRLVRYAPPPPPDLSLPSQMSEGTALIADLIESYESSLLHTTKSGKGEESTMSEFDSVLATVIDPLISAIERSSDALNPHASGRLDDGSNMEPADQQIFVINCLHELKRPLLGHECASHRLSAVHTAIENQVALLSSREVKRILARCSLEEISERMRLYKKSRAIDELSNTTGTPASDPALTLPRIADAMQTFFAALSDPEALPEFRKLQVPLIKAEAVQKSLTALADAYAEVYTTITDPWSGYDVQAVQLHVRHTPDQVRTLLGVM